MTGHELTLEQRAEYAIGAASDFVDRALKAAQMIASSAQRGETLVVAQYLQNLEQLQVEADRWSADRSRGR